MKTIHKFVLEPEAEIETYADAKFLSIQMQDGRPVAWFEVDTNNFIEKIYIRFFGTGHEVSEDAAKYLASVQVGNGLVFHAYLLSAKQ